MPNISIQTNPTGRSPENKYFFGDRSKHVDLTRPQYNRIGDEKEFTEFYCQMAVLEYKHILRFQTCGITFCVYTNDDRHAQFVRNMFTVEDLSLIHI